jgi:hypothetical protein
MTRQMKQTFFTGFTMFFIGLVFYLGNIQDEGIFSYVLLVFGAWELGEVLSDYVYRSKNESQKPYTKESWDKVKASMHRDMIRITLPMLTSMLADLILVEETLRMVTTFAYLITLSIYLLFIYIFTMQYNT